MQIGIYLDGVCVCGIEGGWLGSLVLVFCRRSWTCGDCWAQHTNYHLAQLLMLAAEPNTGNSCQ